MTRHLSVLAVDDERPALSDLARLLGEHPAVDRVELASSGEEALQKIGGDRFDAVLLDVRMPGLDGVELARVLRRFAAPPAIVFVSAYETAAVEAFELRAVDYLVKPVSRARLAEALERVATHSPSAQRDTDDDGPESDVVCVDNIRGGGTRLLPRSSILYLEAQGDYARVVADDGRFLLRTSLSEFERRWRAAGFVRVHRRFVVNLLRASEITADPVGSVVLAFPDGSHVPVARRQVGELRRRLRA